MYKAPTLSALSQSVRAAFKAESPGSNPWLWPNPLYVLGKVLAGLFRTFYQRLEYVHRQAFTSKADAEYLDRHGENVGVTRRPASVAAGACTFVTNLANPVPAGTRLLRSDNVVFVTDDDASPTVSPGAVNIRALEPGATGNTAPGATLNIETPISGIGAFTVGADGISGGHEEESDSSYRARILDRKRNPPHGGSPSEIRAWALEVPGVTRVFVRRATPAAGSVTVLFMRDDVAAGFGIPNATDVANVLAKLQANVPGSANVIVTAPTAKVVGINISALVPNTLAVQEAVRAEIRAMFRRRAEPGKAFSKSWIDEAISMAVGEGSHTLLAPAGDTACATNEIAVPGGIAFP